jgi:hypothetical protein
MTQTLLPPFTATTAYTVRSWTGAVTLHEIPMSAVEGAREEWPDAADFVKDTACTGCGDDVSEIQTCTDCGDKGCRCDVRDDEHDEQPRCTDCARPCLGPCCA